ncbi:MAG TPA: redoxin family protein [Fimbriimonadaceae bacterium]|jgi:hypothetical protein
MKFKFGTLSTLIALGSLGAGVYGLGTSSKSKPKVLLFLSTDCPIAAGYTPRINALVQKYEAEGVQFEALFPNDLETRPEIQAYMSDRHYSFPFRVDVGATEAKSLGVTTVPTAVVLAPSGKEVYRGAVDDNPDASLAKKPYLDSAITATIDGKTPTLKYTDVIGCLLMPSAPAPRVGAVNYAADIKPILEKHCISCHRPGEVAPFSLIGYTNARKWAPNIARVTYNRQMPPWKAVHGYGEFADDISLSEEQILTLQRWNEAGAPKGHLVSENLNYPPVPEWPLGKPDMILEPSRPYKLAADGADVYRNYVIHTNFKETRYVTGLDVKPGNRRVVHHVIAFVDAGTRSNQLLAAEMDGQEGYTGSGAGPGFFPDTTLGGWVPGSRPRLTPNDIAYRLKPGANIVIQVHYHKDGKPEEDLTRAGIYFDKEPPKKVLNVTWLVNPMIKIPAGDADHKEHLTFHVHRDMTAYGLTPHMHLLGKSMKADVVFPDGTRQPLVFVNDWDFNWQLFYQFKEPIKIPAGSVIEAEATYDNSADNPRNPNHPARTVTWGEQTTDEMFVIVLATTIDDAKVASK